MIGSERAALLPAGAVALSAALWGLWWLPLRALADAGLSGATVNAALYGIASLALLPWFWRRRQRLAAGGLLLLGAGGLFGGALVSWNLALILGEVVRVTLLFYLVPVWATLLALAVLGERVGRLRLLSVALGLAGAGVLLGFGSGLPLPRSAGDWLGLAAGLLFALSVTLVRKGETIAGLEQTVVAFAAAALLSLALLVATPHQSATVDATILVEVDRIVGDRSSWDPGINIGGGVTFKLGDAALFYVETRWHYMWGPEFTDAEGVSQKANGQYFPVTFGFKF